MVQTLRIGIMGSATKEVDPYTLKSAKLLGRLLAKRGCEVVTGTSIGAPHVVLLEAKKFGAKTVGFSPDLNHDAHGERYDNASFSDFDDVNFVEGFTKRSLEMINYCDGIIVLGGRMGTLSEYAIAFEECKPIGVLKTSNGIAKHLFRITKLCNKHRDSPVFFSDDVVCLFRRLIKYLTKDQWLKLAEDYKNIKPITDEELGYKKVLEKVQTRIKGLVVLDYGCGSGGFTRRILKLNPKKIHAVDISEEAINIAKKNGNSKVDFRNIKSGELGFVKDGSVDIVFMNFVFCCIPDKKESEKVLREVYRKLKKDGELILLDPNPGSPGYQYLSGWRERPKKLVSGMPLKVKLAGMENCFYDFWRSLNDYKCFFKKVSFFIEEIQEPIAENDSGEFWLDEVSQSPTIIITAKK